MRSLKEQLREASELYARKVALQSPFDNLKGEQRALVQAALEAAVLSGVALTSNFLAKTDGSDAVTPQLIEAAVLELAAEKRLDVEKLKN